MSNRTSSKHLHRLNWQETVWLGFPLLWLAFALGLVLWIPCHDTLWIGGCELGRLLYSLVAGGVFAGYALTALAITLWATWKGGVTAIARLVGGLGLATGLAAFGIMVNEARTAPDLAPERLPELQARGRQEVTFTLEDVTAQPGLRSDSIQGYSVTSSIRVSRAGTYRVEPLHAAGPLYVVALDPTTGLRARTIDVAFEADIPLSFVYTLQFRQGAAGGIAEEGRCTFELEWSIEQVPSFPLYLFGQGLVAKVYPMAAQSVTHPQPEFVLGPVDCDQAELH